MANQNYVLLERIELNQSASSVTFSNIPQTGYTDLKLVMSMRDDYASVSVNAGVKFNGSTANFSGRTLFGTGSAANSSTTTNSFFFTVGTSGTANTFSSSEMYIPNYTSSNYKSVSVESAAESNTTTVYSQIVAGLWSDTSAINSITIYPLNATNFVQYCTFSLYGIANANTTPAKAPKADGGNVIATDGTYWYHAFLSNGTFTPQVGLSADVLVVAGGGGGADNIGGAGGAGGLRYLAAQTLASSVPYTCSIGAGGAGGPGGGGQSNGAKGTNSFLSGSGLTTITATGGGYGAIGDVNGGTGGSGGGTRATVGNGGTGNEGGYSPVEGYNGGKGASSTTAGGGGGASTTGSTAPSTSQSGAGGAGVNTYSSWATATNTGVSGYYAGGGGGGGYPAASVSAGAGGSGGGGAGGSGTTPGTNGTTNTGGGGGGGSTAGGTQYAGGTGGSGIIIVRYLVA